MSIQQKKVFAKVNYERCAPEKCSPGEGVCAAAKACTHKVLKQIDGPNEPPVIFHDLCQGCWDCLEVCPLDAIEQEHIT